MRDSVVVCVRDPEVAVMVTVDVPVGTGFGLFAPFVPLHPARNAMTNNSDIVPPAMNSDLRSFLRFRNTGTNAARPIGPKAPSAINPPRCRREIE